MQKGVRAPIEIETFRNSCLTFIYKIKNHGLVEGNHVLFDPMLYGVVAIVAVVVVALLFYATRNRSKKETPKETEASTMNSNLPAKVERTVTSDDSKRAQNELRILFLSAMESILII